MSAVIVEEQEYEECKRKALDLGSRGLNSEELIELHRLISIVETYEELKHPWIVPFGQLFANHRK